MYDLCFSSNNFVEDISIKSKQTLNKKYFELYVLTR